MPKVGIGALNTAFLLSSSVFVWLAERVLRKGHRHGSIGLMLTAIALGMVFLLIQVKEWKDHLYGMTAHLYGSLYFTITGFHMAHVVVGLIVLGVMTLWIALGYLDQKRTAPITIGGLYWHFVDVVWLFIFSTLYLSPLMLRGR
jgi:heme/copper-type cytochrome/quinol oxidase subunit 3